MAKKLTNNLGLKILAVLIASLLWLIAININDPVGQQTYTVYADIAKTYREISQGDYISKLTEEEHKRQAAEKSRRKKNASL